MRYVNCPSEHDHGSLFNWIVDKTLRRPDQRVVPYLAQLEELAKSCPNGAQVKADFEFGDKPLIVTHLGTEYRVQSLDVIIHAVTSSSSLVCTSYQLSSSEGSSRIVHHLCADVGHQRFNFVLPDGLKSKQIAMKVTKSTPKERAEARKKQERAKKKAAKKQPTQDA